MDSSLLELERRFLALDWTVYPRLVRMRAVCVERVPAPSVARQVAKARALARTRIDIRGTTLWSFFRQGAATLTVMLALRELEKAGVLPFRLPRSP